LLAKGANCETKTYRNITPIFTASSKGHLSIVEALLQKAVDIESKSEIGATPLFAACEKGHIQIINFFVVP